MTGVALDLGTTNAVAATLEGEKPVSVQLRGGAASIPAAVAVDARGRWLVGRDARAQLVSRPADTVVGMKGLLGRDLKSTGVKQFTDALNYRVLDSGDGLCAAVGGALLSMVDAAAMVLRDLKGQAQESLGEEIREAVLPVPDYYTMAQRNALMEAGRRAGLARVDTADESDCLTRLIETSGEAKKLKTVFLYGLGGGIFDATVLERTGSGHYEVVASTGEDLGGGLFDRRIAGHLHEVFLRQHQMGTFSDPVGCQRILEAAEAAKVRLDVEDVAPVQVPFLTLDDGGQPLDLSLSLDRKTLVRLTGDLVRQSLAVVRSVLRAARVEPEEIDAVLLYGRPVRAQEIQAETERFFGKTPTRLPDDAPALGAALLARERARA